VRVHFRTGTLRLMLLTCHVIRMHHLTIAVHCSMLMMILSE